MNDQMHHFHVSPALGLALSALAKLGEFDPAIGALAFQTVCEYVPAQVGDAIALLDLAASFPVQHIDLAVGVAVARGLISEGDLEGAIVVLTDALAFARSIEALLTGRLLLNVIGAYVPDVLQWRTALPWELQAA